MSRTATGSLSYKIEFDNANVNIGDWNQFKVDRATFNQFSTLIKITPSTAGLVHAQVKKCTVSNSDNSASVIVFGSDDAFCRNKFLDFTVVSGFGSTVDQVMTYKAFKWSTLQADDVESQQMSCDVGLQKDAFANTATPVCADEFN